MLSSQIPLFYPLDLHKFSYNFAIMSGLVQAMALFRATFDEYAGKEGDRETLTKAELTELLHNELPGEPTNQADVDNFFSGLDGDKDGVVDFKEYVTFVAALIVIITE